MFMLFYNEWKDVIWKDIDNEALREGCYSWLSKNCKQVR